jgi:hypothetical protein
VQRTGLGYENLPLQTADRLGEEIADALRERRR